MSCVTSHDPLPKTSISQYLISPGWDFALLGGGSITALLALRMSLGEGGVRSSLIATLLLANIINHPHFAHSYQIFYRDFRRKLTDYPHDLRFRYLISGILVPLALAMFFLATVTLEAPMVLGISANLMFFLVGWHYVKQGYGMAMVDAALKRAFFTEQEKRRLLGNAYATWIFSWLLVNHMAKDSLNYFGIPYFRLPVTEELVALSGLICLYTSVRVYLVLRKKLATRQTVAWNGVLAYAVSLYAWLLIRDPVVLLWIPMFHSLQYLTVVWRYEINRARAQSPRVSPKIRFIFFSLTGIGLGYLGFWALPQWLDTNVNYAKDLFGTSLFLYMFWVFINIHHYSLDTVMWRKGNPDVHTHLFSHLR